MESLKWNGWTFLEFICLTEEELPQSAQLAGSYATVLTGEKLLMVHNRQRGQWEMPAGKRESNETPKECAIRELLEETGQGVADMELLGILKSQNTEMGLVKFNPVYFALMDCLQPFLKNEETEEILLWDGYENIGVVDVVDGRLVPLLLKRLEISHRRRGLNERQGFCGFSGRR